MCSRSFSYGIGQKYICMYDVMLHKVNILRDRERERERPDFVNMSYSWKFSRVLIFVYWSLIKFNSHG